MIVDISPIQGELPYTGYISKVLFYLNKVKVSKPQRTPIPKIGKDLFREHDINSLAKTLKFSSGYMQL